MPYLMIVFSRVMVITVAGVVVPRLILCRILAPPLYLKGKRHLSVLARALRESRSISLDYLRLPINYS